jgi:cytochrome b561
MTGSRLPLFDTPRLYGRITRFLHWSIATLLAWQFLCMGLKLIFGRQPFLAPLVGSHQPVGTVLLVLILLRMIWALVNRRNRPGHGSGILGRAAALGHGLLYLLMLAVPVIAMLRAYGNERAFAPFGFQIFAPQTPEIGWMVDLAGLLHGELAWVLGVLILGHVVMVGLHEAMWRDGTFARMARRNRPTA